MWLDGSSLACPFHFGIEELNFVGRVVQVPRMLLVLGTGTRSTAATITYAFVSSTLILRTGENELYGRLATG